MTFSSDIKRADVAFARQPDEALQLRRYRQQRGDRLAVFLARSCSASVKPRLGMNGNGCDGIERQRRQHREDRLVKFLVEPGRSSSDNSSGSSTAMPASRNFVAQLAHIFC